ncbi:MAG: nucleotidyltransferase domain-containing protein [Caldilinea sp. CFX5]|nr:nucleotidyltransferase domain-containing protein [Caldilinea sp. CFX5]
MSQVTYPGTVQHQRVLQAIADCYRGDKRIRAVGLFGSLGRGNWHEFSDLDLDVVIADHVQISVADEIARLCAALVAVGEEALLIVPSAPDAGDVVFASLLELSIRYHPLATTNWKITDSLVLLCGDLDLAVIVAAGQQNRTASGVPSPAALVDRYLHYAVGVSVQIRRQQLWLAIDLLHRMRDLLMQLYAQAYGYNRPIHAFQQHAEHSLQSRMRAMLPQHDLKSVYLALEQGLTIVEADLFTLSHGQIVLNDAHHKLLIRVRQRIKPNDSIDRE